MKKIEDIHIFVVGDIMLDRYIIGTVDRISPEAPVPVVDIKKEEHTLGGSGNVVNNLVKLGCKVSCCGTIGNDVSGNLIKQLLAKNKVNDKLIITPKPTTQKTRIIAENGNQLLRIDRENRDQYLWSNPSHFFIPDDVDIVVISDYAKGMINPQMMDMIKEYKKRIIIDPKPCNKHLYNGAYLITPNKKEFIEMDALTCNCTYILKTLGKDGMDLYYSKSLSPIHIKGQEVPVFNVSGAGDTVVAVMALTLSMGYNIETCAQIANKCAHIVVTKPGTAPILREEFDQIKNEIGG